VETFAILCPFCGEEVEILLEEDVRGSFVQDCEVCCNPWLVRVIRSSEGVDVTVDRGDE
jgi:transcription elongation factor Elf1